MRFLSVFVLIAVTLLAQKSEEQFFRPFGFGGLGLGFGGLGLRPFGLGFRPFGLGLGGLGLGLGVPLTVPVPVPVPVASGVVNPVFNPVVNPIVNPLAFGKREAGASAYGYNNGKVESPGQTDQGRVESGEKKVVQPVEPVDNTHLVDDTDILGSGEHLSRVENATLDEFGLLGENSTESQVNFTLPEGVKREFVSKRQAILPALPLLARAAVARAVLARNIVHNNIVAASLLGKRSVANETEFPENRTECTLSTQKSIFSCQGVNFNFDCGVAANLTVLGGFEHRGENFRMLPEGLVAFDRSSNVQVNRAEIVSLKSGSEFNDFTFVHGGQKVLLSLYWSESVQDLGFRFTEQQCWRTFVDMLKEVSPVNVKLVLDIARV